MSDQRYMVVPFQKHKGRLMPAQMQPALSSAIAIKKARSMASRFAGIAACEVSYDDVTGEMFDPKILIQLGDVPSLEIT